jgi:hypothetical protein
MDPGPDALLRRLTISTARGLAAEEPGCCGSATGAAAAAVSAAAAAAAAAAARRAPRGVATPGPVAAPRKRSFVRPGGVGAAWARCVGAQKTVSVGRKRDHDGADEGGAPAPAGAALAVAPAATLVPRNLADISVFLRHSKRCAARARAACRKTWAAPAVPRAAAVKPELYERA